MKNRINRNQSGGSLLYVLLLIVLISFGASSLMSLSTTSMNLTQDNNNRIKNLYFAIAGSEFAKEELNYYYKEVKAPSQEDLDMIYPEIYEPGFYFYDENWNPGLTVTKIGEPELGEILRGNFEGMYAAKQNYLINVISRDTYNAQAEVTEDISINAIPLGQFAVFYEKDLEIHPGPNFDIEGWVHSNGNLYLGANDTLTFDSRITSVGKIYHERKNDGSVQGGTVRIKDADGNYQTIRLADGTSLDSYHPDWASESTLRWGNRVRNNVHGVPNLKLPIDITEDPHDIIERATMGDSPQLAELKFHNRADVKLVDGVMTDADGNLVPAVFDDGGTMKSIYSTNKTFTNYREGETVQVTEIDVANLNRAIELGLVNMGEGVVYVSDLQGGGNQRAVRLVNGQQLPDGGMTISSDNPIYIQGDYNLNKQPSLTVGDAINILSNNWSDSNNSFSSRNATSTVVNTIVMTGNTETTWGNYNGGLENVLRFLENWSGDTLEFRGSIIDLWYSEVATGNWHYGSPQYTAPNRDWRFDPMYLNPDNQPPGIPLVYAVERIEFAHRY